MLSKKELTKINVYKCQRSPLIARCPECRKLSNIQDTSKDLWEIKLKDVYFGETFLKSMHTYRYGMDGQAAS